MNNIQPHLKIDKMEKYVLLPGDSGRIDKITKYLTEIKEVNTNREYRTVNGNYKDLRLSIVSSGIGCPAAAIAVEELSKIGAKNIIRIGTCGGLLKDMQPGDIVIPTSALCSDGTTKEYIVNKEIIKANEKIVNALKKSAEKLGIKYFTGINRTHDAFYEPTENFVKLVGRGLVSSEMECSAVFLISELRNIKSGAILVVNTPEPPEDVLKNPDIIYRLIDENKVNKGIETAIKISLEAIKTLEFEEVKK